VNNYTREALAKQNGQKLKFRGTISQFGTKRNWKTGAPEPTVMLVNVENSSGKLVTDHLWFNLTKKLDVLRLKEGDRVQFYGIIKQYVKGYEKDQIDYKISYPSKIVKIRSEKKEE